MRHVLVGAVAFSLMGCGLIDQVNGPEALSIQRFVAAPDEVSVGASVTLTWDVSGADTVNVDNGIGTVPARGTKTITAYRTTTFQLTAKSGTSAATASVQVSVKGSGGDPFPFPTPSPEPSPTPSPDPSASPSPDPSPSPSPEPAGCGEPVESAGGCPIVVEHVKPYQGGQCLQLTKLEVNRECPVSDGQLNVAFGIKAQTDGPKLRWRQGDGKDDIMPETGKIEPKGATNVEIKDTVIGLGLTLEVVDAEDEVRMRFTLKHR